MHKYNWQNRLGLIGALAAVLIFFSIGYGQDSLKIKAITETGKNVLLYPNGKWEFDTLILINDSLKKEINFRKTKWGMTKSAVIKSETAEKVKSEKEYTDMLAYNTTVSGLDSYLVYFFVNNKLWKSRYAFNEEHTNKNDYISDFDKIKDVLIKVYGTPKKDNIFWGNDLYKDDYSEWGLAISLGHLSYFTIWETKTTKIVLFLNGDNYKIESGVEYSSKNLEKEAEEKRDNEAQKDF